MNKPIGPYSPVFEAGDWLICSGQLGAMEGKLVQGGFEPELKQVFENLKTILAEKSAALKDVAKTTVFIRDDGTVLFSDLFQKLNQIYTAEFGDHRPARSVVAVSELPLGAAVEMEAWAWRPQS